MQLHQGYVPAAKIEGEIQALLCGTNRMTFMSLANAFPEYTWISLFKALNNLERQQVIKLIPVPWDYEIAILHQPTTGRGEKGRA